MNDSLINTAPGCLLDQFQIQAAVTTPIAILEYGRAVNSVQPCLVIDTSLQRQGDFDLLVYLIIGSEPGIVFKVAVDPAEDPAAALRKKLAAIAPLPQPENEQLAILWAVSREELEDKLPIVIYRPQTAQRLATALDQILMFLSTFIAFGSEAKAVAVALWIAHTWVTDLFRYTPYLYIASPTPRCGKSRLLECLFALAKNSWKVAMPTEAVLFTKIAAESPTLLIDETDAIFRGAGDRGREPMRALLNAGFERGGTIPRWRKGNVVDYPVFCPKALAGIGRIPQTIGDRSIRILMDRKGQNEQVQPYREQIVKPLAEPIVHLLAEWSADSEVRAELHEARPFIPHDLNDRAADIAEPLLALAEFAGEPWVTKARHALTTLFYESNADHEDFSVKLLEALKAIFTLSGLQQLPTLHILQQLVARDWEPWAVMWERDLAHGNVRGPAAKLAAFLHPFGITTKSIRLPGDRTPKGYKLADFERTFERYLP